MHVAYIHQHFSTQQGHTGTRSYEMSQRLIAEGHRVSMICGVMDMTADLFELRGRVTRTEIDGIEVHCIAERYENRMGFFRRVWAFGQFARTATRVALDLKPDLIFATSTPLTVGLPGQRVSRRLNIPFVFEVRDLWPELPIAMGIVRNPLLKWHLRRMERNIYAAADRIIALAPGIQEGICATGYPADRVTLIPNGCDLDLFKPDPAPLEELPDYTPEKFGPPGDFRLIFTGAHGLANGLDAVLDATVELKRRGVKGVRFIFIGRGGQRERLIRRSREEGLDGLTSWLESVPKAQLARILPRMDVGMMILKNVPAFYYGTSPNKFFDYIASGLPVLNNYPGWLAGMIEAHDCGRVVPPDDPKAFCDAVLWLRDHRGDLPAMGLRARALAEAEFSRDKLGAAFVKALEASFRGGRPR